MLRDKYARQMSPEIAVNTKLRFVIFDWGDTLMSEAGPLDVPMANWPEVRTIDGAREVLSLLSRSYRMRLPRMRPCRRDATLCARWSGSG